MPGTIHIEVKGLKELQAAIAKFPRMAGIYMGKAGMEAAKRVILPTEGLQKYPPATAANQPPTPYYQRGMGMVYKNSTKATSENLGKQWYVKRTLNDFTTEIGNRSSYAQYVHGDDTQASFMAPKGWKKLYATALEKLPQITKVYDAWVKKLLKDIRLT